MMTSGFNIIQRKSFVMLELGQWVGGTGRFRFPLLFFFADAYMIRIGLRHTTVGTARTGLQLEKIKVYHLGTWALCQPKNTHFWTARPKGDHLLAVPLVGVFVCISGFDTL